MVIRKLHSTLFVTNPQMCSTLRFPDMRPPFKLQSKLPQLEISRMYWVWQGGKYKEAFSSFKEAVKYKRDSWQTWSNYAAAAVKTESFQAAARAVEQVIHCLCSAFPQSSSMLSFASVDILFGTGEGVSSLAPVISCIYTLTYVQQ